MTAAERMALSSLLITSIGLTLAFVIGLGLPRWTAMPGMAWLWTAIALVTIALDVLLMMVVLRVSFPVWLAIAVLLAQDGVWTWRLVVLYRARRDDQSHDLDS